MEGPHYNAGWTGYGKIPFKDQPDNQAWLEEWEGQLGAMFATLSTIFEKGLKPGQPVPFWGLDAARWGRETMNPRDYMNRTYDALWLETLCLLITMYGDKLGVSVAEMEARKITTAPAQKRAKAIRDKAFKEAVPGVGRPDAKGLYQSEQYDPAKVGSIEAIGAKAKFKVGDRVQCINQLSTGHTREYPYFRGKVGMVVAYYGLAEEKRNEKGQIEFQGVYYAPYPDIACRGLQKFYTPLYSVRFEGKDLWGEEFVDRRSVIYADVFEPYVKLV
jgi:nitrile hydratase